MPNVKDIYNYINQIAPFDSQEEWDNSGLLIGASDKEVKKAVLSLDATSQVCNLAADLCADLIISHHPIIFSPLSVLLKGGAAFTCANNDIAVISAHTNFDKAQEGINANLCKILGLTDVTPIENTFIVTGKLDAEMSIDDFAQFVADKLGVSGIRYTDTDKPIKTVALGGGACEEYLADAMQCADCFLTGDMKYHPMLEAAEHGFAVISAGHFETESEAFKMLLDKLQAEFPGVEFIWANQQNPVKTIDL